MAQEPKYGKSQKESHSVGDGHDFLRRGGVGLHIPCSPIVCLPLSLLAAQLLGLCTPYIYFCGTRDDVKYKLLECRSVGKVLKGELYLSWRCQRQAGDQQVRVCS